MFHSHVAYLAVMVAAAAQWVLGALWYGLIFSKPWKALVGIKEGEKYKGTAFALGASFVASFILCFVLVYVIVWARAVGFGGGAFVGLIAWLGFMAPPLFAQHLHEHRRFNLFAINAGYWLLAMALAGGVLAAWR